MMATQAMVVREIPPPRRLAHDWA
eukprot:SAG22_NODE_8974_length_617_cov_1.194981_1_plen_24_part_10